MKRAALLLALTGCVGVQTIHEYCTANAARYRDYDQCYAERQAQEAAWRSQALAKKHKTTPTVLRCTSTKGLGRTETECKEE